MPARVSDEVRAAVVADVEAHPEDTIAAIARRHGVGPTYVRKLAQTIRGRSAPERTAQTENATRAAVAKLAARRAALAVRLQDEAERLVYSLREPFTAFNFGGKDNTYAEHRMDAPDVKSQQIILTAAAIAIDKQIKLLQFDAGDSSEAASLLGKLGDALTAQFGDGSEHRVSRETLPDEQPAAES